MLHRLPIADPPPAQGFSWANLLILVVVVAVLWPLLRYLRRRLSRQRRRRWAQDERDEVRYTEENDPDLRRDPP